MKVLLGTLASVALALTLAAPASAQSLNTNATGAYGQVDLRTGFEPDPHAVTLSAGGSIDASTVNSSCSGHVASRPDVSLRFHPGQLPLFISATSDSDTTLVVRAPDGSWHCDDDSGGNLNPSVHFDHPSDGRYQIWVGTFSSDGATPAATLNISEIGSGSAEDAANRPDMSLDPTYGSRALTSGFEPDPFTQAIDAGGDFNAAGLGQQGCVGYIARAPDYRIQWTAGQTKLPLVFSVESDADTTLVINDAHGNWICDDDGGNNGLNPAITIANPDSGQYDVWVGTFAQGPTQKSTLNVSELYAQ